MQIDPQISTLIAESEYRRTSNYNASASASTLTTVLNQSLTSGKAYLIRSLNVANITDTQNVTAVRIEDANGLIHQELPSNITYALEKNVLVEGSITVKISIASGSPTVTLNISLLEVGSI